MQLKFNILNLLCGESRPIFKVMEEMQEYEELVSI